jgi:exopolyphosphatase/guanosine-5'-triphosphate,3'-diphosphate pyrophosphatase
MPTRRATTPGPGATRTARRAAGQTPQGPIARAREAARPEVYAVADIGSNSAHLLVAVCDGHALEPIADESVPTDLGHLVERRGSIGAKAAKDVGEVVARFRERAERLGARHLAVVATEPLRRADDRTAAGKAIAASCDGELHVLSHEEEGFLTVLGLVHGYDADESLLVADVGGGSTEIVELHPHRAARATGVSIGTARLMARVSYQDPPRPREWQNLRRHAQIALADVPRGAARRIVLVGGTATRMLKLVPATMLDRTIERDDLATMGELLARHTAKEIAERSGMSHRRARLLPAGISIVEALLRQTAATEVHVDGGGIREGVVVALARRGPEWRRGLAELLVAPRRRATR